MGIVDLLAAALPKELKPAAGLLAERVVKRPGVALHAGKRWAEVTEGERELDRRRVRSGRARRNRADS
jgi:hypothetical protein